MAIYHANIKNFSRGKGESATAAAAYRAGIAILDTRTRITHDYTKRSGVISFHMLAPAGTPAWCNDPSVFFDACERWESRANAMVARELEVSLPAELDETQRRDLALRLGQLLVDRYQVVVLAALHAPAEKGDQRNFHVHLLMSSRQVGPEGLGERAGSEFDARKGRGAEEIHTIRKLVSITINAALAKAGIADTVDHRSLRNQAEAALQARDHAKAKELSRLPTRHIGKAITAALRRSSLDPLLIKASITSNAAQKVMQEAQALFAKQDLLADAPRGDTAASDRSRNAERSYAQSAAELNARLQKGRERAAAMVASISRPTPAEQAMAEAEARFARQGRLLPTPKSQSAEVARAERGLGPGRPPSLLVPSPLALRLGRAAGLGRAQGLDAEVLNAEAKLIEDWLAVQHEIAKNALASLQAIPGLQVEAPLKRAMESALRRRVGAYGTKRFFYEDSEVLTAAIVEYAEAVRHPSEMREELRRAQARVSEVEVDGTAKSYALLNAAQRALSRARGAVSKAAQKLSDRRIDEARAVMVAATEAMERDYYITPLDRVETSPPLPYTAGLGGGERNSDSNRQQLKPRQRPNT